MLKVVVGQLTVMKVICYTVMICHLSLSLTYSGGYGVDFSYDVSSVQEGMAKVSKGLLSHGVTSFCPTLVTSPTETYHQVLPQLKKKAGGAHGATVLGVHVEGPFISIDK